MDRGRRRMYAIEEQVVEQEQGVQSVYTVHSSVVSCRHSVAVTYSTRSFSQFFSLESSLIALSNDRRRALDAKDINTDGMHTIEEVAIYKTQYTGLG